MKQLEQQIATLLRDLSAKPSHGLRWSEGGERAVHIPGQLRAPHVRGSIPISDVSLPDLIDDDGRPTGPAPRGAVAGKRLSLPAYWAQRSRVLSAGARLVPLATLPAEPLADGTAFEQMPEAAVAIMPVPLAAVADADDTPLVPGSAPWSVADGARDDLVGYGAAFELGRRDMRDHQTDEVAAWIARAVADGVAKALDHALLSALSSASPALAEFTLGAAAAKGCLWNDLRGIVGTDGTGATVDQGQLYVSGVPAELSDAAAGSYVADWRQFGIGMSDQLDLLLARTGAAGQLTVTAWAHVGALMPDPNFAWAVTA